MLIGSRELVEQGRFSAVLIANKSKRKQLAQCAPLPLQLLYIIEILQFATDTRAIWTSKCDIRSHHFNNFPLGLKNVTF